MSKKELTTKPKKKRKKKYSLASSIIRSAMMMSLLPSLLSKYTGIANPSAKTVDTDCEIIEPEQLEAPEED